MSAVLKTVTLPVKGMTCAACAASVEKAINGDSNVKNVQVNFATNTAQLTIQDEANLKNLAKLVKARGYELVISSDANIREDSSLLILRNQLFLTLPTTVIVVVLSMFIGEFYYKNLVLFGLTTLVLIFGGGSFYKSAWKQLKIRSANMDTLIALGTGSAFLFSTINTFWPKLITSESGHQLIYFESAAVIISFILLGKYLEERAKFKTSNAIKSLYELAVKSVERKNKEGEFEEISIEQLHINDVIRVKAGQKIPVDGQIEFGVGAIDESFLTGESIPLDKTTEEEVYAGTILKSGALEIRTFKTGKDTKLSQVIDLVQQAMGSKAPAQKLADRIAAVFVPIVLLIAITTGLAWFFLNQSDTTLAFINTFNVLIIACPCALGLATPMAIMVGIGNAAKSGILIKDAEALQVAKDVKKLFLDKTGTISEGSMSVLSEHLYFEDDQKLELLSILFSLESSSVHPIAEALTNYLKENYSLFPFPIANIETLPGVGLQAKMGDSLYRITALDNKVAVLSKDQREIIKTIQHKGQAGLLFMKDNEVLAIYALSDSVKSGFKGLVDQFRKMGLELEILSGDNEAAVAQVAYEIGIEQYQARLMPEHKAQIIKESMEKSKVAFAGDGINDAPALATANLGIAMGTGTDVAMNTAGVTISSGKLDKLLKLFRLSRTTNRIMRQNLFWAFIYNVLAIPAAAGLLYPFIGYVMDPMLAGFAMAISSVSVVLNSLRLNWV